MSTHILRSVCYILVFALIFSYTPLVLSEHLQSISIFPQSSHTINVNLESPGKSYVLSGEFDDTDDFLKCTVLWMAKDNLVRTDVYDKQSDKLFWLLYAPATADHCIVELQNTGNRSIKIINFDFSQKLVSAYGEIMEVSDAVDITEPMTPEEYWSLFPPLELPYQNRKICNNSILRQFFDFGFTNTLEYGFDVTEKADEMLNLPVKNDMLGKKVEKDQPYIIAGDIKYNPIMKDHYIYSNRYYPRRMHDYLEQYFTPAYILSKDEKYLNRMEELLDFLMYSKWEKDGSNKFVQDVFPDDYTPHPEWFGAFDYLFDWEWLDGYRYLWSLHEADHHVCSSIAGMFVTAYQITGKEEYFNTAYDFVYNQFPQYGFHKGVYKGQVYYWTEYNPTGLSLGNPINDATDNICALTASACAKVAYFTDDPVLKARFLELARGLLWYMVREFDYDGWFYYDGAENPINQRKAVSHDTVCLRYAFTALAYLYKAGADIDLLLERFDEIDRELSQKSEFVKPLGDFRVYKLYEGDLVRGNNIYFTTFIKVKTNGANNIMFSDAVPLSFKARNYMNIRISKINPPDENNPDYTIGEDIVYTMKKGQLYQGIRIPFELSRGDIIRIGYELICTETIEKVKINASSPKITATISSDSVKSTVTITTNARGNTFNMPFNENTIVNPTNFLSLTAMINFPFDDESCVVLQDHLQPKCIEYKENRFQYNMELYMLKPLIRRENMKIE